MPDNATRRALGTMLAGPFTDRAEAWTECRHYAALLVKHSLTPTWGVEVRATVLGSSMFGVYLQSYPPGQPLPPHLLAITTTTTTTTTPR